MKPSVYKIDKLIPLQNLQYHTFILDAISNAKKRIWASIFIADVRMNKDKFKSVMTLIKNLEYAKWRNIDIKIILGVSRSAPGIHIGNETTASYLDSKNIPIKYFGGDRRSSLHSKYVIIDDELIILGSHNWSNGAFLKNQEDSLAIRSSSLTIMMSHEFNNLWKTSLEVDQHEN